MAEAAPVNGLPQTKLEEKLLALEARFAALEKENQNLHEKVSKLSESSTDKSTENSTAPVCDNTRNQNLLEFETILIITASIYERNDRERGCESCSVIGISR